MVYITACSLRISSRVQDKMWQGFAVKASKAFWGSEPVTSFKSLLKTYLFFRITGGDSSWHWWEVRTHPGEVASQSTLQRQPFTSAPGENANPTQKENRTLAWEATALTAAPQFLLAAVGSLVSIYHLSTGGGCNEKHLSLMQSKAISLQ